MICVITILKILITSNQSYKSDSNQDYHYTARKILTQNERKFFDALQIAAGENYIIFAKMGLWNIIQHSNKSEWNKIAQKHIDFVLYDHQKNKILVAIELDDKSHNKQSARKNDRFKDTVLQSVNIPLLRIKAQQEYNINLLKNNLENIITNHTSPL